MTLKVMVIHFLVFLVSVGVSMLGIFSVKVLSLFVMTSMFLLIAGIREFSVRRINEEENKSVLNTILFVGFFQHIFIAMIFGIMMLK